MQYGWSDCQSLSLINCIVNQGKYDEYFKVEKNGSNWNVTFKKKGITKTVTQSDLNKQVRTPEGNLVVAAAHGDKDIAIIEAALRLAVAADGCTLDGSSNGLGDSRNYDIVSKYIFGSIVGGYDNLNEAKATYIINEYVNGRVSNVVLGTTQNENGGNQRLGIVPMHAYSVKTATFNADGSLKTVTVVNPHDTKDEIKLDKTDFLKYFEGICLFGDTYTKYTSKYPNIAADSRYQSDYNQSLFFGGAADYQNYIDIFHAINAAGGCETVPDDMMYSTEYLTNILNGGFAYLKMYDNKTGEWVDTSVAINTSLQEVADESKLRKAEAKYEADMRRIDMKDRKYDYDLAALENERNAIKNEMETLKTVAGDNVERTFKLFS